MPKPIAEYPCLTSWINKFEKLKDRTVEMQKLDKEITKLTGKLAKLTEKQSDDYKLLWNKIDEKFGFADDTVIKFNYKKKVLEEFLKGDCDCEVCEQDICKCDDCQ